MLTSIILFIFGFNYLKGTSLIDRQKTLYAVYEEVDGLLVGANVMINGLSIGNVTELEFLKNSTKILVTLKVKDELNFSSKSTASIFSGASSVLNKQTQLNIKESIEVLTSAINSINNSAYIIEGTLTEKNDKISKTIDNIESISENLSKVTKELNEFGLSNVLVDLKESTEGINSVIQNLNSDSSSLGKLINKDELYVNLNSSIISLNNLIDDINENPKKYVHFSIFCRK